jgi:GNAT superfamily N-acetyltransferase
VLWFAGIAEPHHGAAVPSIANASEDPPSSLARAAVAARASPIHCTPTDPRDPGTRATLQAWLDAIPVLERRPLSAATRARLEDSRTVIGELARVLDGTEAGEGRTAERTLHLAIARGRVHGVCAMFACPRATFVELLVTAPWNVLGPGDPPDPRTVRGAGTALVAAASTWSAARGCGGAVALQAATLRAAAFYERFGFRRMRAEDGPLGLVPPGDGGWSPEILRVAAGRPGPKEQEMPWLVLAPSRGFAAAPRPRVNAAS